MLVYLIVGEASGDLLGARLMRELKTSYDITFAGIGGTQMEEEGLRTLFPMSELSLMGFVEILPHLPRLLRHIKFTVADILARKPDVIVTIDSPGFNFRVAKKLRETWPKGRADSPRFIHYVAPSVWAYKPGRAKKLAKIYDEVLTLLPFEPPYFEREGMEAHFVGHPLVEAMPKADGPAFRARHDIPMNVPVMSVLPGSRMGELKRHLPVLRESVKEIAEYYPDIVTVMPAVPHLKTEMQQMTALWPSRLILIDQGMEKWDAFAASNTAIAKSGTVTLELSITQTPMVVMYKVHPLSAWLMRKMKITRFVTLVNILLNREVIPELLQEDATAQRISTEMLRLLRNQSARDAQTDAFESALQQLGFSDSVSPSRKAADVILHHAA